MSTDYHRSQEAILEKPSQMSVKELRSLLAQFGETNRDHFEQNKVKKAPSAVSLSSSGSTSVALLPQEFPQSFMSSFAPKPTVLTQATEPIFRDFDMEEEQYDHDFLPEQANTLNVMAENFRIMSIRKVAAAPHASKTATTGSVLPWDEADDFSDPWASSTMQPKARRHNSVNDAKDKLSMEHDNNSVATGHVTDPGIFSPQRVKAQAFRNKLPILICKSQKDEDWKYTKHSHRGDLLSPDTPDTTSAAKGDCNDPVIGFSQAPRFNEHSFTKIASFFLQDDRKKAHFNHDDGSTLSLFTDDSHTFCDTETGGKEPMDIADIGNVFTNELAQEQRSHIDLIEMPPYRTSSNQMYDPCDLNRTSFVRSDSRSSQVPALASSTKNSGFSSKDKTNANALAISKKPASEAMHAVVARFGGKSNMSSRKKSAVQRRREELEQKWAADRSLTENASRKVTWQTSNGRYKKKVVLDFDECKR